MVTCTVCGKSVQAWLPWQLYCSAGCKMKAYWTRRLHREAGG